MLGKHKAMGLDGFTPESILNFWYQLRENFLKFFEEFYSNGKRNSCIKENFICLIPKKEDTVLVKDLRRKSNHDGL